MVVKCYCGENTSRAVFWEDSTMPKFLFLLEELSYNKNMINNHILLSLVAQLVEQSAVN